MSSEALTQADIFYFRRWLLLSISGNRLIKADIFYLRRQLLLYAFKSFALPPHGRLLDVAEAIFILYFHVLLLFESGGPNLLAFGLTPSAAMCLTQYLHLTSQQVHHTPWLSITHHPRVTTISPHLCVQVHRAPHTYQSVIPE